MTTLFLYAFACWCALECQKSKERTTTWVERGKFQDAEAVIRADSIRQYNRKHPKKKPIIKTMR
jgi:hypothetical protein